ncbi:MAG TPA: hypothetical protein VJ866_08635 [Pyrinomonadaceae bacterium]|nr:hypothetical protein [Pyrinomonadaceae bacterium]
MSKQANDPQAGQCDGPARRETEIAEAIIGYLREHPLAMDTLEGIAEWWLPRYQVKFELQAVERAVRRLVAQGVLEEIEDSRPLRYHLPRR